MMSLENLQFYTVGSGGPVFLWLTHRMRPDDLQRMEEETEKLAPGRAYTVAALSAGDWDADFAPWPADVGDRHFAGRGPELLERLQGEIFPEIRSRYGEQAEIYIMGYSLAGLYALWCAYQTAETAGAISGSGTMWFPGWDEYSAAHVIVREGSLIYLSLGGKEAAVSDPVMSTIEDLTKKQWTRMKADPHVRLTTLEMNSGGHFADEIKRLAKGIVWVLKNRR